MADPAPAHVLFLGGSGFLGRWIRFWTRSPLAHVAILRGGVVLNPTLDGDVEVPGSVFLLPWASPSLRCSIAVPCAGWEPDYLPDPSPRPLLPPLLRWLTRGRTRAWDCVTVASAYLRSMGVPVPARIHTPQQLHDWLIAKGYPHEQADSVGGAPACAARIAHADP